MGNNTQANVTYSNELFKQYVLKLSTGLIWKNQALANESESSDVYDRYRTELFILANQGRLLFSVVRAFPRVILQNVFAVADDIIERYASDKTTIPLDSRESVVEEYQRALRSKNPMTGNYAYYDQIHEEWVEIYQEQNNYYRMLMGVPDTSETSDDYVHLTHDQVLKYVDENDEALIEEYMATPIQNLPTIVRYQMEIDGTLSEIIEQYPEKKYLPYIGRRKIDYYTSRSAEKFALLWRDSTSEDSLNEAWDNNYEASRRLITSVYYTNAFKRDNSYYDNFLAMSILFVTIHQMQIVYLKSDFTRDFYDLESLKIVYDSYGVPFYSEIPIKYHKKVVKNINRLISGKGSDNVFFDLFNIFDMGTIELYNYFLVKRHKVDADNNPIFYVKYVDGHEGGFVIDEDSGASIVFDDPDASRIYAWYEHGILEYGPDGRVKIDQSSYDWFFSKVPVGSDPTMVVSDESTYTGYNIIIDDDPYWVEDDNVRTVKTNANINFIESKYLGINTVVDMMKIVYESSYMFRMILDNVDQASTLTSSWSDVSANSAISVSILDMVLYICLLISRISGYEELITDRIPAVAETLGYNFEELTAILAKARRNKYTSENVSKNKKIYSLIDSMSFQTFQDFDDSYEAIAELKSLIAERYLTAESIQEFEAYRDLYRTLMTSKEITETYINPEEPIAIIIDDASGKPIEGGEDSAWDVEYCTTITNGDNIFTDLQSMLDYYNPNLLQRYLVLADDSLSTELNLALIKFEDMISSVEYIPMATSGITESASILDSLLKILKFFKSVKAEILDFNIVFVIRDRDQNFFRTLDRIKSSNMTQILIEGDVRANIDYIEKVIQTDRAADIQKMSDLNQVDVLYEYIYPNYGSYIIDDESGLPFESGRDASPSGIAIAI